MFETLQSVFEPFAARLIAGIAGGAILLGLAALAIAMFQYFRVRNWAAASARILSSAPGFELRQKFQTEQPRNVRVAKITYQFDAAGRSWRSNRILDSGDPADDQTERLLAAYPVGATVTIRHDPKDPSKSALEIDHPPKDLAMGCLAATLIVVVFAAICILFVTYGIEGLQRLLPDAILPLTLAGSVIGLLLLMLFVGFQRRANVVRRWPTINGRVVSSGVHEFQQRRDKPQRTIRGTRMMKTMHMPVVEYSYAVGGRDFTSRSIWDGTEVSGSRDYAQGIADRYPVGRTVTVHYDPAAPGKAALEVGGNWHWAVLAGAIIAFAAAAWSSGYFT